MYARDISRKVRSAHRIRGNLGEPLSQPPYGYIEGMTCCDISNWIRVNNNAISYFGGITQTVTPDNCKVAVRKRGAGL